MAPAMSPRDIHAGQAQICIYVLYTLHVWCHNSFTAERVGLVGAAAGRWAAHPPPCPSQSVKSAQGQTTKNSGTCALGRLGRDPIVPTAAGSLTLGVRLGRFSECRRPSLAIVFACSLPCTLMWEGTCKYKPALRWGPCAMDTKLAHAPVTRAYGHSHNSSTLFCLAALQRKPGQCPTRGGGWLVPTRGSLLSISHPPPLRARRDGAMMTGIHTPPHPPLPPTVVVFVSGLIQLHPTTKGHEATDTGLAYAPVSQAHGHNHIVQCFACCTAA